MRAFPCGTWCRGFPWENQRRNRGRRRQAEDNYGESDIPIIVSTRSKEILLFQLDGMLTKQEVEQAMDFAFEAAEKVKLLQIGALREKYMGVENNSNGG